jgi:hypothetical protein
MIFSRRAGHLCSGECGVCRIDEMSIDAGGGQVSDLEQAPGGSLRLSCHLNQSGYSSLRHMRASLGLSFGAGYRHGTGEGPVTPGRAPAAGDPGRGRGS